MQMQHKSKWKQTEMKKKRKAKKRLDPRMQMRCTTRVNASTYWSVFPIFSSSKQDWGEGNRHTHTNKSRVEREKKSIVQIKESIDYGFLRAQWKTIKQPKQIPVPRLCECFVMYLVDICYRKRGDEYKFTDALAQKFRVKSIERARGKGTSLWTNKRMLWLKNSKNKKGREERERESKGERLELLHREKLIGQSPSVDIKYCVLCSALLLRLFEILYSPSFSIQHEGSLSISPFLFSLSLKIDR